MNRKRYQRNFVLYGQRQKIISLWWYGLALIVNQKWKNRFTSRGKLNTESQFYTSYIQEQKTEGNRDMNREEKNGFKPSSRLD